MAIPHRSSRQYSRRALEAWLPRLTKDWETGFSREELKDAQRLYREGGVRSVELTPDEAVIHIRHEGATGYAHVAWIDDRLDIRFSVADRHRGQAFAAAGLYEIDELVADEISPVGIDPGEAAPAAPAPTQAAQAPGPAAPPARPLMVRLDLTHQGLRARGFWLNENGSEDILALHGEGLSQLNHSEREKVIRLMGLAIKAGFEKQPAHKAFLLPDIHLIERFFGEQEPRWRKAFRMDLDEAARSLSKGCRVVRASAVLGSARDGGVNLSWRLECPGMAFTPEQADLLLRRGRLGQTLFLPGHGAFRLEARQAEVLQDWAENPVLTREGNLPPYMMYSLFGQSRVQVHLSPELAALRDSMGAEPDTEGWPDFLRPYQRHGVAWLAHLCACGCHPLLADEMGLGKTVQTATLLTRRAEADQAPDLIVCPSSVIPVWRQEFARWFPGIRIDVMRGGRSFDDDPAVRVWLTSYSQLRRIKGQLDKFEFRHAVLDEAQQIKNPESKVSLACCSVRGRHRIALTGTPVENSRMDLWTIFRFLMPGLLGSRKNFIDAATHDAPRFAERLRAQISPFVLRRTKAEVERELPEKVEITVPVTLTEVQMREYRRLTEEAVAAHGDNLSEWRGHSMSLLTLLTRLRQVSCDPALLPWMRAGIEDSGKLTALLDLVDGFVQENEKCVVFSQFTSFLDRVALALAERFPGTPVYHLTGSTHDRAKPVREFQKQEGAGVFLASLKAGGVGITLHSAVNVVMLDPWWNPAAEAQAIDRVHRIGQARTVFVHRLVAQGTVEERVEHLKAGKRQIFQELLGGLNASSDWEHHFLTLRELAGLNEDSHPLQD